jgi:hypothetical protein
MLARLSMHRGGKGKGVRHRREISIQEVMISPIETTGVFNELLQITRWFTRHHGSLREHRTAIQAGYMRDTVSLSSPRQLDVLERRQ